MRPLIPSPAIEYIRNLFAVEDPVLQKSHAKLSPQHKGIQIAPEEGRLLQLFIQMAHISTVVEIGALIGYSSIWMARALPSHGMVHTIEKDPLRIKQIAHNVKQAGLEKKVKIHPGEAAVILPELAGQGPFDMIFIDADKGSYCQYLDWAEQHIRHKGLIIADNTLLFDQVYQEEPGDPKQRHKWQVMRTFNKRLANPEKYMATMLATPEGMTVAIKLF